MINIIILVLAYLIGSIPSALVIGKLFYKGTDIRKAGSGNLGSTNMLRTLGIKAALATAFFDIFIKGSLVTFLAVVLYNNSYVTIFPLFIGMISAIGHAFPIFAHFKGGKCVATSIGILLAIDYKIFLLAVLTLIIVLLITKIMSLGSFISIAVSYTLVAVFYQFTVLEYIIIIIYYFFILYLHRTNIKRIINRDEKKIDVIYLWKTKVLKQQVKNK